jgi:hypothetical protein
MANNSDVPARTRACSRRLEYSTGMTAVSSAWVRARAGVSRRTNGGLLARWECGWPPNKWHAPAQMNKLVRAFFSTVP